MRPGAKSGASKITSRDLEVTERFEAGIELLGTEVRSLKEGRGVFSGGRVLVRDGQVFMVGVAIPAYQAQNAPAGYDPGRTRRLLLKHPEIIRLVGLGSIAGALMVPTRSYVKGKRVKIEIVVGKRKKKFDKREDIKRRDVERSLTRDLKRPVKF